MMPIADFTKEKGYALRKYFVEFVVFFLVCGLGYIFNLYTEMNRFVREELLKSNLRQESVIERNTLILQSLSNKK